ncbi:MAG: hypothetical protein ABIG09_06025 [bacterium]
MAEEKVLTKYCFQSIVKLKSNLEFVDNYNQNKRLKKLNDKIPVQYLKKRRILSYNVLLANTIIHRKV